MARSRKNSDEVKLLIGESSPSGADQSPSLEDATASSSNGASGANQDFIFIKIVARIVLQLLRKFWAFSSAAVLAIVLFYWLCGGILAFSFVAFACTGLLYHAGDKLLYHPDQPNNSRVYVPSPSIMGMAFESLYIKSKDQTRLHMFFIKSPAGSLAPTILFLHGNAGNIGHRIMCIKDLVFKIGCNVCLLEYRGYGHSDGSPCEDGMYLDGQAALDYLVSRPDVDQSKIVVFGRSLGGAVAIDLCSKMENRSKVSALIVENSFTSIPDIARVLFNFKLVKMIPKWFYKNRFDSRWKVKRLANPTLFISGSADNLVPPGMMTELFNACGADAKYLAKFAGGTHNDTWNCAHYLPTIAYFLEEVKFCDKGSIFFDTDILILQIVHLNGQQPRTERLRPPPTIVSSSQSIVWHWRWQFNFSVINHSTEVVEISFENNK